MTEPLSTRLPVYWCQAPDPDESDGAEHYTSLRFRINDGWFAVDSDQLVLPITVTGRDGNDVEDQPGLLKQYGGESMLNDMLVEAMSGDSTPREWQITHENGGRREIHPLDTTD